MPTLVQTNNFKSKLLSWSLWLHLRKASKAVMLNSFLEWISGSWYIPLSLPGTHSSTVSCLKLRKESNCIFTFTPNYYSCSLNLLLNSRPACSVCFLVCLRWDGRGTNSESHNHKKSRTESVVCCSILWSHQLGDFKIRSWERNRPSLRLYS